MEDDVEWAPNWAKRTVEMEKKPECYRTQKLENINIDTPVQEDENSSEPTNQRIAHFKAEERVKISSDLHWEILDLGGAENITELRKRKKTTKRKSSYRVPVELPVLGPVDTAEFMYAAIQGKLKVVEKYLVDGGNPNFCDKLRRTALHRASIEGHIAVIQMLLEKGADIHFKDRLDSRAIHWACRGGRLGVVKILQRHGADLDVRDKLYSTPLHVATRTGHDDIVEYLLSCRVKINSRDREGDTALHDAVRLNRYKIVKLLIVAGADTKIINHEGMTAVEQVKQWQFHTMETLENLEQLREVGLLPSETTEGEEW